MLGTLIEVLVRVWHNFRRRKPIRSGTVEYPQPTAVIRSLIQRLLAENMQESWADSCADRSEAWVQVALRDKTLAVNFAFPFKGGLTEPCGHAGLSPPAGNLCTLSRAKQQLTKRRSPTRKRLLHSSIYCSSVCSRVALCTP